MWCGSYGLVRCPAHDDRKPSLSIRDGEHELIVNCFAGCDWQDVKAEFRRLGLLADEIEPRRCARTAKARPAGTILPPKIDAADDLRRKRALRLWNETSALGGTLAETFLTRTRGLSPLPHVWPISLRFHPVMQAMVAAISGADHRIVAVQITRLDPLTADKAATPQPRKTYGRRLDGAVRLGAAAEVLALAEGVETALAYSEMFGVVTWAVLGKVRFGKVAVPAHVRSLHLCADTDSVAECEKAKRHYQRLGLDVTVRVPAVGKDFNDMLVERRRAA
jgi:hypothetical protein